MEAVLIDVLERTDLGPTNRDGDPSLTLHLHDTFGAAGSCVERALELGVRSFDGSVAGLGGCPYASTPGKRAPGNIATETLVGVAHRMGYATGVDLDALGRARVGTMFAEPELVGLDDSLLTLEVVCSVHAEMLALLESCEKEGLMTKQAGLVVLLPERVSSCPACAFLWCWLFLVPYRYGFRFSPAAVLSFFFLLQSQVFELREKMEQEKKNTPWRKRLWGKMKNAFKGRSKK